MSVLLRYQQMKKEGALNQNIGLFFGISFLPYAPLVTEFDTVSLSLFFYTSLLFWLRFKNLSKCINVRCYFGIREVENLPESSARIKVKVIEKILISSELQFRRRSSAEISLYISAQKRLKYFLKKLQK